MSKSLANVKIHPGLHVKVAVGVVPFVDNRAKPMWSLTLLVPISDTADWPTIKRWATDRNGLDSVNAAIEQAIDDTVCDYISLNFSTPDFVKLNGHKKEATEWQQLVKANLGKKLELHVGISEVLGLTNADGTPYNIKAVDAACAKSKISARSEAAGHQPMSKARQLIDEYTSTASIPAFDMPQSPAVAPPTTRPATRPTTTPAKPGVKPWKPTVRPGVQPRPKAKKRFQANLGRF